MYPTAGDPNKFVHGAQQNNANINVPNNRNNENNKRKINEINTNSNPPPKRQKIEEGNLRLAQNQFKNYYFSYLSTDIYFITSALDNSHGGII